MAHEADLSQLREAQQKVRESADLELNKLVRESADLRATHEATSERLRLAQRLINKLKAARDTALSGLARAQVELQETRAAQEEANKRRDAEVKSMNQELRVAQEKLRTLDTELHQAREDASHQLLRTNEAHERAIERLNQHLNQEAQKARSIEQMQLWIGVLRGQLSESEQARDAARERLTQYEQSVQQFQEVLGERDRQVKQLESQLAERSRMLESRAQEIDSLKQALDERLLVVRKDADRARAERSEVLMEKQALERRLREAEQQLTGYDQERNQFIERMMEMDKELQALRQDRANETKSRNDALEQLRDELNAQMKEMQTQRDRTAECLREANSFLVEQTANKQMLLDQLKTSQDQYSQTTSKLRVELDQGQREKIALQRQIEDLTTRLARAETMVRDADARCAKAEQAHRRTTREVEKLALESASKRAVTQATACLFHSESPKPADTRSSQLPRSVIDPSRLDCPDLVGLSTACRQSERLSPTLCSPCWSGSTADLEWMVSPHEEADRRKVKFHASPRLNATENTRPIVPDSSNAGKLIP
ncbi:unnamed protein product [Echinostoma caproni]|uniref:Uncharacterized protein n=1 Tax=Echinostoma caproni TaxID=27848 RepID=A0A3P8GK08_9TREM|nr:unnamed protein product [Echinostoma caproni]